MSCHIMSCHVVPLLNRSCLEGYKVGSSARTLCTLEAGYTRARIQSTKPPPRLLNSSADVSAAPCCYCKKSLRTLMKAPGPPSSASSCTSASVCCTRRSMAAELDLPRLTVGGGVSILGVTSNGVVRRGATAYLKLRC